MDEKTQTQTQPNNTGSYSTEYVKELRDEAASWRTKFREAETKAKTLEETIAKTIRDEGIKSELSKRGLNVDPDFIKVEQGQTVEQAIDGFLKKYPQFSSQQPPTPTRKPMHTEKTNTNIPSIPDNDYQAVKNDPVARAKLREQYRAMLAG